MKHTLDDNRLLMASYDDIYSFFKEFQIVGKIIKDIIPFKFDYYIRNLDEIDNILSISTPSSIDTDHQICLVFTDNTSLEIEFVGDGPVILGYNTAKLSKYPKHNGSCYTLRTLFKHSINRKIIEIEFNKTVNKMLFPYYKGIDLSKEDDGIKQLRFILDDGSYLSAEGILDWFCLSHKTATNKLKMIPFRELLAELNHEYFPFLRDAIQAVSSNK